jgi:hypothetical protein
VKDFNLPTLANLAKFGAAFLPLFVEVAVPVDVGLISFDPVVINS